MIKRRSLSKAAALSKVLILMLVIGGACSAQTTSWLDNGTIKVGVDLTSGGAIHWLGQPGGSSVINIADLGRYVQQSYYSGPHPFGTPHPSWPNWGWNPIQVGDCYGNRATVIAHNNNGQTIYTKTVPKQWALNNVNGDCTFEQWTTLDDSTIKVRCRLNNTRSDTTWYGPRDQELPAVYTVGTLSKLVTYTGTAPFTSGALTEIVNQGPPWANWTATENWAAHLTNNDWGLAIYTPGICRFLGGFSGTKGTGGPTSGNTGYIAPIGYDILDHNIVYEYEYVLILANLTDIRNYINTHRPIDRPKYVFATDRQRCYYKNTTDTGFPINGKLRVRLNSSDPQVICPQGFWKASNAPKLHIRMALIGTSATNCKVYYMPHGGGFSESCAVSFNAIADGRMRTYELNMASSSNYTGNIVQLRFDPTDGGAAGAYADIEYISAVLSPSGSVVVNSGAQYTHSTDVTLTLSASSQFSTVTQMRFSNDEANWSSWQSYAKTKTWTLPSGSGIKHVYVQFRDAQGLISRTFSDSIVLDRAAPSVPTNVQAAGSSPTSVNLTWNPSTDDVGIANYRVFRNGSFIGTALETDYTDIQLAPHTTYSYRVSACDVSGRESAQSSPPAVATTLSNPDTVPPSTPTNVTATGNSLTSISLTWTASTDNVGVAGYRVRRNGVLVSKSTSTGYVDTGLTSGTTYSYRISAYDEAGNISAESAVKTGTTMSKVAISNVVPSNYVVTTFDIGTATFIDRAYTITTMPTKYRGLTGIQTANNDKDKTDLDFRFTIDKPAEVYLVLRAVLTPSTPLLSGFADTGDEIRTTDIEPSYKVWKKTYSAGVVSLGPKPNAGDNNSMYFVLLIDADTSAPSVPSGVVANPVSSSRIQLHWTASTDNKAVAGYKVYRNGGFVGATTAASYADIGLSEVTRYSYRVSAYDAASNESAQSSPAAVATTLDSTPPSVPTSVVATPVSTTSIQLNWTASTDNVGVAGYKVYRNGSLAGSTTTANFLDSGRADATTYSYRISAYDAAANASAQSSPPAVATTFDGTPPSVPVNVQAVGQTPRTVNVTWTASTDNVGVTGYKIYRNGSQVGTTTNTTSFSDNALTPCTSYSYTVSAYDAASNNSPQSSPAAQATTLTETDIAAAKKLSDDAQVGMVSKIVTAIYSNSFYVEETDRQSGIKIVPVEMPEGLVLGCAVDIGGTLGTVNGERVIYNAVVNIVNLP